MQTANVLVNVGGDRGNQVPKFVTAAEIAVLRAIHGDESVSNIDPVGDLERTNRDELTRLRETYGRATDGENRSVVGVLFPGAGARVFETLDELGLPDVLYKPTARASAKAAPAAEPVADDAPEPEAKKTRKSKKAEAEAAPAVVDDEGEGVTDMADAPADPLFA